MNILFFVILSALVVGCDNNESTVFIPEPTRKTATDLENEMTTIIQMSGGNCYTAKSVYEQQTFLGNANIFNVSCTSVGYTDPVTYLVDKNNNTVNK